MDTQHNIHLRELFQTLEDIKNGDFSTQMILNGHDDIVRDISLTVNEILNRLNTLSYEVTRVVRESGVNDQLFDDIVYDPNDQWQDFIKKLLAIEQQYNELAAALKDTAVIAGEEQRRAEQALYERRRYLHLIISSIPNLMLIINQDDKISAFLQPPGFPNIFKDKDFAIGQEVQKAFAPALAEQIESALWIARDFNKTSTFEHTCKRDNLPETYNFEVKLSPIADSTDTLMLMNNITERIRAEQELSRLKDDFIANASHELRTPIYAIKGLLDLLVEGKVDNPDVQKEFLLRASESADRLVGLSNVLLDVTQLESGQLRMEPVEFDLRALINEAILSMQNIADMKNIWVQFDSPAYPMTAFADRYRIGQVLTNLLGNALKFSENWSDVRVNCRVEEKMYVIEVIDHGPGVPENARELIFEKFRQSEHTSNWVSEGIGLGLYISKMLIEAHGGKIGVESVPGEGSTFYFSLPSSGL